MNDKNLFVKSGKRGRPAVILNYPDGKFTINTLMPLNPHVKCRLSFYNHLNKMVKKGILRQTGETRETGKLGRHLTEFQTMSSFRRARTLKRNNKSRNKSNLPDKVVSLNPVKEQVPVNAEPATV